MSFDTKSLQEILIELFPLLCRSGKRLEIALLLNVYTETPKGNFPHWAIIDGPFVQSKTTEHAFVTNSILTLFIETMSLYLFMQLSTLQTPRR